MSNIGPEKRICPLCGSGKSDSVIRLSAWEIVRANWSYREVRFSDMGIDPLAQFTIERCSDCAFVYAGSLPTKDFLGFVYDQLIDIEAARRESFSVHNIASRMENLAALIRLIGGSGKVLDYGCGFGPALALLKNARELEVAGFDTSTARIHEIRSWHPLVTQDLEELLAFAPFNAVILDNVLEHIPDPRRTIALISSICAEDAILFVSVPDTNTRYLKAQIGLNKNREIVGMDINPWEHLNYFDLEHLDSILTSGGFFPLKQGEIPGEVRIGLRPERRQVARFKNSLSSILRCMRYAITGDSVRSANRCFYRYKGKRSA